MDRIALSSGRLVSRSVVQRLVGGAGVAAAALALLGVTGCGQAGLVEPEAPVVQTSHPLTAPASGRVPAEVLHASVEVFGLEIARLNSTTCTQASGALAMQTEVEAAALIKAIRSTGGEARTELGAGVAPSFSDYTFRDGDVVRHYQVDYRAGGYAYVYDNGGIEHRTGNNPIPEGAEPYDMHSALLLLRAWRPRLDETAYFYVVLGRRPWRVDVTSRGPEMIKLGEDPRLTYRIDGVAVRLGEGPETPAKHFSLWLSEGAERAPLKMVADASFGQATLTLTGRETGERECPASLVARAPRQQRLQRASPPVNAPAGWIGSAWTTPRAPQHP